MNSNKILALIIIVLAVFLPSHLAAQSPTDVLPPIPISDAALRSKEVGITVFGFTIPGITLDGLLISGIVKPMISQIVNSTVNWINSGFKGNPAFVTNPKQYFKELADGIAGDFIAGSDLDVLCSPFQAQIRLALQKSYTQPRQFQCTFTQALGNLESFYNNFNEGGWDAWFAMTQNNSNNPYGSYLETKIALDARITDTVKLKREQLNQGRGFLSYEKCDQSDPSYIAPRVVAGVNVPESCSPSAKRIVTPGSVIETQLSNVLNTSIRQLELADEFDEIVGALVGQLLQKTVFSVTGLLGAPNNVTGGSRGPAGSGTGTVSTPPSSSIAQTPVEICTASCAANFCPASIDDDDSRCDYRAYNACVNQCVDDSMPPTPPPSEFQPPPASNEGTQP